MFAAVVALVNKPVDSVMFAKIALVILALVPVGDFFVELEEGWEDNW